MQVILNKIVVSDVNIKGDIEDLGVKDSYYVTKLTVGDEEYFSHVNVDEAAASSSAWLFRWITDSRIFRRKGYNIGAIYSEVGPYNFPEGELDIMRLSKGVGVS